MNPSRRNFLQQSTAHRPGRFLRRHWTACASSPGRSLPGTGRGFHVPQVGPACKDAFWPADPGLGHRRYPEALSESARRAAAAEPVFKDW